MKNIIKWEVEMYQNESGLFVLKKTWFINMYGRKVKLFSSTIETDRIRHYGETSRF